MNKVHEINVLSLFLMCFKVFFAMRIGEKTQDEVHFDMLTIEDRHNTVFQTFMPKPFKCTIPRPFPFDRRLDGIISHYENKTKTLSVMGWNGENFDYVVLIRDYVNNRLAPLKNRLIFTQFEYENMVKQHPRAGR